MGRDGRTACALTAARRGYSKRARGRPSSSERRGAGLLLSGRGKAEPGAQPQSRGRRRQPRPPGVDEAVDDGAHAAPPHEEGARHSWRMSVTAAAPQKAATSKTQRKRGGSSSSLHSSDGGGEFGRMRAATEAGDAEILKGEIPAISTYPPSAAAAASPPPPAIATKGGAPPRGWAAARQEIASSSRRGLETAVRPSKWAARAHQPLLVARAGPAGAAAGVACSPCMSCTLRTDK